MGTRPLLPNCSARLKALNIMEVLEWSLSFRASMNVFPNDGKQSLCIDLDGSPIKIPWLLDHQHKGVPFWKCCTLQPAFRDYLRLRVIETLEGGAQGIHIDDHMGNAAFTSFGACFCERCKSGFRNYLNTLPTDKMKGLGITELDTFDFQTELLEWRERSGENSWIQEHPLWHQWEVFHCYQTRLLMQELKSLARKHQGRYVPFGAKCRASVEQPSHRL